MKKYRHFFIFSLIGVLCVFIDYFIYLSLWHLSGHVMISKIMSSIVSVSVNYLLNSRFNFNNQQKENIKFYSQYLAVYTVLIILNAIINSLFFHLTANIKVSFWLAAIIAAFTNYFTVKVFFKKINARLVVNDCL
ncbi:MAG: GtrA family protein [Patescibacteria group bacterium]|nr:GtrA family protein [Patescibacteria group bacterium]